MKAALGSSIKAQSIYSRPSNPIDDILSVKPDLSNYFEEKRKPAQDSNTVEVQCTLVLDERTKFSMAPFEMHNSRKTTDLINKGVAWLRTNFNYDGEEKFIDIQFKKVDGSFTKLEKEKDLKVLF